MPTSLAVQSDVEALLGAPLSTQQAVYVQTLLSNASSIVRAYCRQSFSQTIGDVVTLQGNWGTRLTLPQRPVTNVSSVVIRSQSLPAGSWVWDRFGHIDMVSSAGTWNDFDNIFGPPAELATGGSTVLAGGQVDLNGSAGSIFSEVQSGPSWSGPGTSIVVTYDHGFATIPGEVINEVAGLVAGQFATPTGIGSETIGNYKVVYSARQGGSMALSDASKMNLNRYRVTNGSYTASLPR